MLESLRRSTEYFESSDTGQSEYPRRSSPGMLKSMLDTVSSRWSSSQCVQVTNLSIVKVLDHSPYLIPNIPPTPSYLLPSSVSLPSLAPLTTPNSFLSLILDLV
ncbi:hypothetical protein NLI96_g3420 [Meripilus lineatus]|uniref:Uncharacterized protein n=1 Tax=Meripilus lineatus TaxID=2056292 RepID=A0AAD5V6T4_9APHY|nr:hypothetical protein NLI96_g3420 [Physisporinus lineatus]